MAAANCQKDSTDAVLPDGGLSAMITEVKRGYIKMEIQYYKEYSEKLGRYMEYKTYGTTGKICIAFASQNGRFYDFENWGMVDVMAPWIESGQIQVVTPDSIDEETWSNEGGDLHERLVRQEAWFSYITDELMPAVRARNKVGADQEMMATGCSMGAIHSANFFFRRPDLFDTVVALSGTYDAHEFFYPGEDGLIYDNSPTLFLRNMPGSHPWRAFYKASRIIICVGQGAWEDQLLAGTRALDTVCAERGISAWFDYWGFDVAHDWPWWQKQLHYFMGHLYGEK